MSNMVVRTNMLALNSHRNLGMVGTQQARASARLSSGFRINSAADDAAGLGISENMRAQIRGLDQASRNAQDAISLAQTAEGGLTTINEMIVRIRELTVQASNDINTNEQDVAGSTGANTSNRARIQQEINHLISEVGRTAETLQFNGMTLLDGTAGTPGVMPMDDATRVLFNSFINGSGAAGWAALVAGQDALEQATLERNQYQAALDAVQALAFKIDAETSAGQLGAVLASIQDAWTAHQTAGALATNIGGIAVGAGSGVDSQRAFLAGSLNAHFNSLFPGHGFATTGTTLFVATDFDAVHFNAAGPGLSGLTAANLALDTIFAGAATAWEDWRDDIALAMTGAGTPIGNLLAATPTAPTATEMQDLRDWIVAGGDLFDGVINSMTDMATAQGAIAAALMDLNTAFANIPAAATYASLTDMFATFDDMLAAYNAEPGGGLWFQVGANQGQGIRLELPNIISEVADSLAQHFTGQDWSTLRNAPNEIGTNVSTGQISFGTGESISNLLNEVDRIYALTTAARGELGAFMNRVEFTIQNLDVSSENLQASNSRIRDADMAAEMMRLTQANVLQQAATAMLAQGNQAPQSILQLLG